MGHKIKFLVGTGSLRRPSYRTGEVIEDAPLEFMQAMVRQGIAEWVGEPPPAKNSGGGGKLENDLTENDLTENDKSDAEPTGAAPETEPGNPETEPEEKKQGVPTMENPPPPPEKNSGGKKKRK